MELKQAMSKEQSKNTLEKEKLRKLFINRVPMTINQGNFSSN